MLISKAKNEHKAHDTIPSHTKKKELVTEPTTVPDIHATQFLDPVQCSDRCVVTSYQQRKTQPFVSQSYSRDQYVQHSGICTYALHS